jgi:predicted nucleotidyltransferase
MKDSVLAILNKEKDFLRRRYHVNHLGLFGSVVRGEEHEKSDIDILVDFDESKNVSLFDMIHLKHYLEDTLHRPVDLVHEKMIKPNLRHQIISETVIV